MRIKGRHLEFLPGSILGSSAGLVEKDEFGEKYTAPERVLNTTLGATLGGVASRMLGKSVRTARSLRVKAKEPYVFNSAKEFKNLNNVREVFKKKIENTPRPMWDTDPKESFNLLFDLDLQHATNAAWVHSKANPTKAKIDDSFFGATKINLDYNEPKTMYRNLKSELFKKWSKKQKQTRRDPWEDFFNSNFGGSGRRQSSGFNAGRTYTPPKQEYSGLGLKVDEGTLYTTGNLKVPISKKSEVKKIFRSKVQKAHPDKGGSDKDFIKIKEDYDAIKKSSLWEKLAYYTLLN